MNEHLTKLMDYRKREIDVNLSVLLFFINRCEEGFAGDKCEELATHTPGIQSLKVTFFGNCCHRKLGFGLTHIWISCK